MKRNKPKINLNMTFLFVVASVLTILSFPYNPLVIFNLINPILNIKALYYIGWVIWPIGIILIALAYYNIYIRKSKVIIKHGIYRVVRNPLYLGWILAIFIASIFMHQHWLFIVFAIFGITSLYLISMGEEYSNIEKFGKQYKKYMEEVPRMNIILGIIRSIKKEK